MRSSKIVCLTLILSCCLIPWLTSVTLPNEKPSEKDGAASDLTVLLYRSKTGKTEKIPLREYLCGVVAAEMEADYAPEALKAQAVSACSYLMYRYEQIKNGGAGDPKHPDAYVCDDFTHCKGYLSEKEAKKRWGKSWFDEYYGNIRSAVAQVYGQVITYDGKVINAVYHAISSGTTESAENVWGAEVPYLRSVDSSADTAASGYETTLAFTEQQTADLLKKAGVAVSGSAEKWFGVPVADSAGSVESVTVCGKTLSGTEVRKIFSLRSTAFSVAYKQKKFIFTTHGYGHQVGMSQFGANQLALDGKSYAEILRYYYTGTKIENYKF